MHASTLSILGKSESTAEATSRFLAVTVSATGRSDELTDTETGHEGGRDLGDGLGCPRLTSIDSTESSRDRQPDDHRWLIPKPTNNGFHLLS